MLTPTLGISIPTDFEPQQHMNVVATLAEVDDSEYVALRRDLHSHPELAFEEQRTSGLIAERLAALGYTVRRGMGGTGVVGQLRRGAGDRHIGLRADMDALPIQETGVAVWASRRIGVMHACGHDGHTAMLMAAAERIARDETLDGIVTLIFQPAEEYGRSDSGAARMIADGLFDKYPCDAVFAMHNAPGVPQGMLLFRDGPSLASSDHVVVTLTGKGGHGGMPHTTIDPVPAAASLVMALQTIVSRNIDPLAGAVVSVGMLQAGSAYNVVPQTARLEISVRAMEPAVRDTLESRVKALVTSHAESFGVKAEVAYERGYPPLVNSSKETAFALSVARELLGSERVIEQCPASTGAEDFSFMLERRPGCYLLIGNGAGAGPNGCMVHNSGYDFNDDNIPVGAAFWALLVKRYLDANS